MIKSREGEAAAIQDGSGLSTTSTRERQQQECLEDRDNDSLYQKSNTRLETRLRSIRDANRTAKENRTDRMEDYLEVIYELVFQKGYATTIDISEYLNVSSPSVTRMMKKLHETEFLKYEKYRGMSLTDEGIEVAKAIRKRHGILFEFFRMIGVKDKVANEDTDGIEHHLHTETLRKLEEFLKKAGTQKM
jgi:DtxR family transcriptional regulator, manganese transport regulator